MSKTIKDRDFVDSETIRVYEEINGLKVIEETLLFLGTNNQSTLSMRDLERVAIVVYRLKVNATNKLYVGLILDKFYHRAGLIDGRQQVKIPKDIYQKVDAVHAQYRTHENTNKSHD